MYRAFEIAGYPNSEVDKRFGGMVKGVLNTARPRMVAARLGLTAS